jgi:hypothetical protein
VKTRPGCRASCSRRTNSGRAVDPPEHRSDAREQLAGAERLDDVIVCAELQADHSICFLAAGRQHDDRRRGGAAQLARDVEAVHARQPEVEYHQVGWAGAGGGERSGAVGGSADVEACRP